MQRFAVIPAVYLLLVRGRAERREILLQLRAGTGFMDGYWACGAAGHVELGESLAEAAGREAAEELGISDLALRPLCAMHRVQGDDPIGHRVDYFLLADAWRGEPRIMEPAKCADLQWFELSQLPEPVVPHELAVIERLCSGSVPPIIDIGPTAG